MRVALTFAAAGLILLWSALGYIGLVTVVRWLV